MLISWIFSLHYLKMTKKHIRSPNKSSEGSFCFLVLITNCLDKSITLPSVQALLAPYAMHHSSVPGVSYRGHVIQAIFAWHKHNIASAIWGVLESKILWIPNFVWWKFFVGPIHWSLKGFFWGVAHNKNHSSYIIQAVYSFSVTFFTLWSKGPLAFQLKADTFLSIDRSEGTVLDPRGWSRSPSLARQLHWNSSTLSY